MPTSGPSSGVARFNLNLVATSTPHEPLEPLLPPPTLKEAIEQVLTRFASGGLVRRSILASRDGARQHSRRDAGTLPAEWAAATTVPRSGRRLREAVQIEREYQLLSEKLSRLAAERARAADVRGIQRLLEQIQRSDAAWAGSGPTWWSR